MAGGFPSLSLLCFFSFSSLLLPFSSLPSLLSSLGLLPSVPSVPFIKSSPVFIGKNRGDERWGGHCWPPPPLTLWPTKVCKWLHCGRLFEEEAASY